MSTFTYNGHTLYFVMDESSDTLVVVDEDGLDITNPVVIAKAYEEYWEQVGL